MHKYVKGLEQRLAWAYKKAREVSQKENERAKRNYDCLIQGSALEPGDLVLVRQKAFKGKHKIQDRWENTPYYVIEKVKDDVPVYKIQKEGECKTKTLHRNLLFPLMLKYEDVYGDNDPSRDQDDESLVTSDIDGKEATDDGPAIQGPITRNRAKQRSTVLARANALLMANFEEPPALSELNMWKLLQPMQDTLLAIKGWIWK